MLGRARAWSTTLFGDTISVETQQSPKDLLAELSALDTITAVRLVGHLVLLPSTLTQTDNHITHLDVGIGVASAEAFAVSGGIPDPNVTGDTPARGWLWRYRMVFASHNADGTEDSYHRWPEVSFDLRAMRKVDRGKLYFTFIATTVTGTLGSMRLSGIIRALCLT